MRIETGTESENVSRYKLKDFAGLLCYSILINLFSKCFQDIMTSLWMYSFTFRGYVALFSQTTLSKLFLSFSEKGSTLQ